MTGAGTVCLQLLGEGKAAEAQTGDASIQAGYQPTLASSPTDGGGHSGYGWYYMTQAMFHGGAKGFAEWNKLFAPLVIRQQKADGHWETEGSGGHDPYMFTALNCLSLQVYYRCLPSYKVPTGIASSEADVFDLTDAVNKGL